jgi:DNA-binding HxlR family transcriptional regulator
VTYKRAVSGALVPPVTPVPKATASAGRRDHDAAPVRDVLERIGDKWSVIVICRLDGEPRRFNELRRLTDGITQRMLSLTLRRLERDGLVTRTVFPTVPPQVEYGLTDRGRSLHDVLSRLVEWTDTHLAGIQESRAKYDAR